MKEFILMTVVNTCINYYSSYFNVDKLIVKSIIKVESNYKHNAVSIDKEDIGLMQIRYKYHDKNNRNKLFDSCYNIKRGTKILKDVMDKCKHKDMHSYVVCYNLGITGGSKLKYPKKFIYYKKIMEEYGIQKLKSIDEQMSVMRK